MNATSPITYWAHQEPEAPALSFGGWTWSYAALELATARWAHFLAARGVSPGDRVAWLSENAPSLVPLLFAVARLGAVSVPLNARLTAAELAPQLELIRPKRVFADPALIGRLSDGAELLPKGETLAPDAEGTAPAPVPLDAGAIFACLFTSGTTGAPRAVALTWGNLTASAAASAVNLGGDPEQRWLCSLPLFHVGGLATVFRTFAYGADLLLHRGFDAERVNDAIDRLGVTHTSLVSTTLARLLDARGQRPFPPSLRAILVGGGPIPPSLLSRARALGAPVLQTYGLTEACSQVTTEPLGDADGLTAGSPLPGIRVRVVGPEGNTLAPGEVGEIEVAGPTVMAGYLGDESETHQALWKGWLRTRDLGRLDSRGRLEVLARRAELIVSGGENVYPAEVERALTSHPAVAEAAVLPAPDPEWGQVPWAAVVCEPAVEDAALLAHCRARLAGYKLPRRVVRVEALPRNALGKVDRAALSLLLGV